MSATCPIYEKLGLRRCFFVRLKRGACLESVDVRNGYGTQIEMSVLHIALDSTSLVSEIAPTSPMLLFSTDIPWIKRWMTVWHHILTIFQMTSLLLYNYQNDSLLQKSTSISNVWGELVIAQIQRMPHQSDKSDRDGQRNFMTKRGSVWLRAHCNLPKM